MKKVQEIRSGLLLLRNHYSIRIGLFIILCVVMYAAMYSNVQPEKLNLSLFSIAERDILSPITVEDTEATFEKRQAAAREVEDQFILKSVYADNRVEIVSAIFNAVEKVNTMEKPRTEIITNQSENLSAVNEDQMEPKLVYSMDEKVDLLMQTIPEDLHQELPSHVFLPLLRASKEELDTAKNTTITAVQHVMKQKIAVSDVENKKSAVAEEIKRVNIPSQIRDSMIKIAQYAIIPNYIFDMKATEEMRRHAMEEVEPVKIQAGQVIVKEGQLINREIYKQLELTGLLDKESQPKVFFGLGLLVILIMGLIYFAFQTIETQIRKKNTYVMMYTIIFTITIVLMKVISLFGKIDINHIGFITPIAMAAMLIKMLINDRVAIISSMIFAICGSIIFNNDLLTNINFMIGIYLFFSMMSGVIFLREQNRRSKILKTGLLVAGVNIVSITTLILLNNIQYSTIEFGSYVAMAFMSGFLSSVLTLGLMPFFESCFGVLSTMKLIELSNPNHPLLRKILTEAPGTYHHSVMVANLGEAACEAIGADGLLARVAAYYHDLGKAKRPHFFIENQINMENPHDNIAPQLSKTIIISHTTDGAELLRKHKLPKEIVDIAEQHHGTTLLKYFYHKAMQQTDTPIQESDFRYPGPKPQTKESAIIGIADSVEAAVRSLSKPTPNKIESIVRSIISDRLQDGQFDECDMTLKELDTVAKSLCESLQGIFHSRIEYPEVVKKKVKEA